LKIDEQFLMDIGSNFESVALLMREATTEKRFPAVIFRPIGQHLCTCIDGE